MSMELESVSLKLPRDLLSGAQCVASARDVTIGHLVRVLLKREVDRQLSCAKNPNIPDPRLVTALLALLEDHFMQAVDWADLHNRLAPHGYALHPQSDRLSIVKASCGTHVCFTCDLGFSAARLSERLGREIQRPSGAHTRTGIMPAGNLDATRHAKLEMILSVARSWPELINTLASSGMEMRLIGVGLGFYLAATGRHLCNSDAIGAPYPMLVQRFGTLLPAAGEEMPPCSVPQLRTKPP